jgi:hypothetical protein
MSRLFFLSQRLICIVLNFFRGYMRLPPSLGCWLTAHPSVAAAIKWQFTFDTNAYDVPESAKKAWPRWSSAEKQALVRAFEDAWTWYKQPDPLNNLGESIPYPPINMNDTSSDTGNPQVAVPASYAWDLYLRWIALNLLVEIDHLLPWSVLGYNEEQLQVLFDSAAIMSRRNDATYVIGSSNPAHPSFVKRKDNQGASLIAPPRYTYAFLTKNGLVGGTRLETINRVLQWVSDNLTHFYGASSYGNMAAHWQYRGIPPISRVIEGTMSTVTNSFAHWTAGCHGTTGLLRNVLRAANIPVHIVRICGHSLVYFMTEGLYLDHGDNPYNSTFRGTGLPASTLLIDETTYTAWFGSNMDNNDFNCPGNVGQQVNVLAGP